jgi:uncharacterized protein involved in exopolysaccharide biosynthesis
MLYSANRLVQTKHPMTDDPVTLFDIRPILRIGRWRIAAVGLLGFVGGLSYGLLSPKWYQASVAVVTAGSSKGGMSGAAAAFGGMDLPVDLGLGGADVERLAAIFKSASVTDAVIAKFHLMARYKQQYIEDTRDALQVHCSTKVDKKPGIVSVTCEDTSPQMARDMVAYYAEFGNEVALRISASSATEERRFLEKRLEQSRIDFDKSCRDLRDFQQQNGVISLPDQAKAVVESIATLRAEMISKQTQLAFINSFSASDEATSSQLRAQVGILKSRLKSLEGPSGKEPASAASASQGSMNSTELFPPAMNIPPLQYQLGQVLREQRMQEVLVTLLTQRYEIARINEARDTSTFQVLDNPVLPTKKIRPKVRTSAITGMILGIFIGLAWAIVRRPRQSVKTASGAIPAT